MIVLMAANVIDIPIIASLSAVSRSLVNSAMGIPADRVDMTPSKAGTAVAENAFKIDDPGANLKMGRSHSSASPVMDPENVLMMVAKARGAAINSAGAAREAKQPSAMSGRQ